MTYDVRKPTAKEKEDLKSYLFLEMIDTEECQEIDERVDNAHIGVIDDYISDCPGYTGKLLFVVWGFTGAYELYAWDKENIYKIDSEI